MAYSIGLSFIILSTIVFPLFIFYKLKKLQNHFNDIRILKLYGIFFIGLNDDSIYWEIIVVNFRKLALIICATLLLTANSNFKVIIIPPSYCCCI